MDATTKHELQGSYGQFCPVAMAAEIFCTRWTPLILRELMLGSRHFNDLRRGVPRISPTLLSKRLKELQQAGIVAGYERPNGTTEYHLTQAGMDLGGLIMSMAMWGTRWVDTKKSLENLDPTFLMWDMRRNIKPDPVPSRRLTIQFQYPELTPSRRQFWLVVDGSEVDLCYVDPGYDVDLYLESSLRVMTSIWMGISTARSEMKAGRLDMSGAAEWREIVQTWLGGSPMAQMRAS